MAEYAVMPKADYQDACDAVREKTGSTEAIKSGELGAEIRAIDTQENLDAEITEQAEKIEDLLTILGSKAAGVGGYDTCTVKLSVTGTTMCDILATTVSDGELSYFATGYAEAYLNEVTIENVLCGSVLAMSCPASIHGTAGFSVLPVANQDSNKRYQITAAAGEIVEANIVYDF